MSYPKTFRKGQIVYVSTGNVTYTVGYVGKSYGSTYEIEFRNRKRSLRNIFKSNKHIYSESRCMFTTRKSYMTKPESFFIDEKELNSLNSVIVLIKDQNKIDKIINRSL